MSIWRWDYEGKIHLRSFKFPRAATLDWFKAKCLYLVRLGDLRLVGSAQKKFHAQISGGDHRNFKNFLARSEGGDYKTGGRARGEGGVGKQVLTIWGGGAFWGDKKEKC